MRFGVNLPNAGPAAALLALAERAEARGWDGVFLWDHLQLVPALELELHDPWTLLGAMAARTSRVRLGTLVTPLARRQPWEVAKQVVTLDHLSGGRAVLGVGLGEPPDADFEAFGLDGDPRARATRLDESLALLDALFTGEPVEHDGPHWPVHARLLPRPVQAPRPPVWVAGTWPGRAPFRRAARHDGVFPIGTDRFLTPSELAEVAAACGAPRPGFDVLASLLPGVAVADWAAAGATWLIESRWPVGGWLDELWAAVDQGPPAA